MIILDTDHVGGKALEGSGTFQRAFAWKAFLRGMNPILMDDRGSYFETVRDTMGQTLRFAGRINLKWMTPRGNLTSTNFALASPGRNT